MSLSQAVSSNGHRPKDLFTGVNKQPQVTPSTEELDVKSSIASSLEQAADQVEECVRQHPKIAIAAALGFGCLVAATVRRLRR